MIEPILLAMVCAAAITGAVYDLSTFTIPNWISLGLLALFPASALATGLSLGDAGIHLAVGAGALLVGMALFAGGIVGGGDAKLFAALALYMGLQSVIPYVFAVALAGGVLAALLLVMRWLPVRVFLSRFVWMQKLSGAGVGVPYGVAIAAGAIVALPATQLFASATAAWP
jgi:prepilin peptidase CpaA